METKQNKVPKNAEKLKEIPKWTRKYARNRTLPSFVVIVIAILTAMAVGFPLSLVIAAFEKGNMILACVSIIVLAAILIFLFIICVPKFSGVNIIGGWMDKLIYRREGTALMPEPKSMKKKKWLGFVVGPVVGGCILGSYHLSMEGYISFKYMQPVSALYLVPFLVHLYFIQRPRVGPLILICPILYTIHAILIIAGVPIYFTGNWCILNMFLPVFGYTFLAHVICYVYSRYALKKLKGLTHPEGEAANEV
ncbi:MAG: hypothetical protein GY774_19830 [Planctomycetes bacterium]|nr:hypothetical protein [Planctomycetota bacterium]